MKALRLQKEVVVEGPDFWGRKARIKFTPSKIPGWFWRPNKKTEPIPITVKIVEHNKNRLTLAFRGNRLHVYEHIGVLRFLGIDGVIIESTPWPPYHGRVLELWDALKEHCTESTDEIKWSTPKRWAGWQYQNTKQTRFTHITRSKESGLSVCVIVEYGKLGRKKLTVKLPKDKEILLRALEAYSQGWPLWRYNVSRAASFFGWPHHNKVTWPQEHTPQKTIELFALHRLVDLLGCLSLASHTELIAGTVLSKRSGHWADLKTVRALRVSQSK